MNKREGAKEEELLLKVYGSEDLKWGIEVIVEKSI